MEIKKSDIVKQLNYFLSQGRKKKGKSVNFGISEQSRAYHKSEYDRSSIRVPKDSDFYNDSEYLRKHYKYTSSSQRRDIIKRTAREANKTYSKMKKKKTIKYSPILIKISHKSPQNSPRNSIKSATNMIKRMTL